MTSSKSTTFVPTHLGLILDGNRRWAKAQGLPNLEGHRQGFDNLQEVTRAAIGRGVKYVSAYVFSTENWNRTPAEVKYLMSLALKVLTKDVEQLNREGVRVVWLGTSENLSPKLLGAIRRAEELTKNNTKGTLCLCFNYGGHKEIADAAQKLVDQGETVITEEKLAANLYGGVEIPPIDYIIRTSGEQRLSNFMLWRAAYSELYFTSIYWPAFTANDLDDALNEYANRQRRFGK
jgi:undecaprenyl diphosphate synthase